jgi:hypothetical protein
MTYADLRVVALSLACAGLLAACGGGGGAASPPLASTLSSAAPSSPATSGANVLTITVGRANKINLPMTSVTVCEPGTERCQTIDRILVDTGSSGLRLVASSLTLDLPGQSGSTGGAVGECAQFADGYLWGGVRSADVKLAGETAGGLAVQVVDDADLPGAPDACASTGRAMDLARDLGANGILGLSAFRYDCGSACERSAAIDIYYECAGAACRSARQALASQVANPVPRFAAHNNGVIVALPAVPATGAATVQGSLVLGIGTLDNNGLGGASVYALSALTGCLLTYYKGESFDHSFLDTGSNALFFKDASIPACASGSGFFCSPSPQQLTATIQGHNGANVNVAFAVGDADTLIAGGASALSNVGAPTFSTLTFDWGVPFFYGRRVYVAVEGAAVPGASSGPFVAF